MAFFRRRCVVSVDRVYTASARNSTDVAETEFRSYQKLTEGTSVSHRRRLHAVGCELWVLGIYTAGWRWTAGQVREDRTIGDSCAMLRCR